MLYIGHFYVCSYVCHLCFQIQEWLSKLSIQNRCMSPEAAFSQNPSLSFNILNFSPTILRNDQECSVDSYLGLKETEK